MTDEQKQRLLTETQETAARLNKLIGLLMAAGAVAIIKLDQRQEARWEEGR